MSEKTFLQNFRVQSANGWTKTIEKVRGSALEALGSFDLPNTHQEEWRFTNLAPLKSVAFEASPQSATDISFAETNSIVFVNGHFSKKLSRLPKGITAGSLKEQKGFEDYFGKLLSQGDLFAAWNTAFFQDAAVLRIPDHHIEAQPVNLIFVNTGDADTASFPRALVIMGKQSQATIIESHFSFSEERYLSSAISEVFLEEGAHLQHIKIQRESAKSFHIASTQVHQEKNSSYSSFFLTFGAVLSRENLGVQLDGIGGDCTLNGLYLIGSNQHTDHHTTIDHAKPHGTSRELYKGILNTGARAVFNGKIIVRKDAQKTDAEQTNRNLLLSEGARVNSTPQLEILADDVKCRHGATIGHLDEEAMFYLRSRGLAESYAQTLLMKGFLQEVTSRVSSEEIQTMLNQLLDSRLAQFTGVSA